MNGRSKARHYMATDLVILEPDTPLHRALNVLVDNEISGAPVVDAQGALVGVLTEKDCFRAAFEAGYHREPTASVAAYMATEIETIDADTEIFEVLEKFFRSRYRRFPVLEAGRLVGQLSRRDVLRALDDLW